MSASERLEQLHSAGEVFTSSEVESEARPSDLARLAVAYPPDLFSVGVGGLVVAEFVVDTMGRVEPQTFSVVSSPHLLFSHAVYAAVESAGFIPALRAGRPARQIVQMRFRFDPPGGR